MNIVNYFLIPYFKLRSECNRLKYTKIYRSNGFRGVESKSGFGSDLNLTTTIRDHIPKIVKKYDIKSLLDAPCGDFFWMKEISLPVDKYIGVDIVHELISNNNKKFSNEKRIFLQKDIIYDDVPKVDLILCRDFLVHICFKECFKVLKNFKKSSSKYLLTTTFTEREKNNNLEKSFWRTLNLQIAPFNFPKPILLINENCSVFNNKFADKHLGLWRLDSIEL